MSAKRWLFLIVVIGIGLAVTANFARAQGPHPVAPKTVASLPSATISYQGQLKKNGAPVYNTCSMAFNLYDAVSAGTLVAGPVNVSPVTVTNGLFTVLLTFSENPFIGPPRWLATDVLCAGDGITTTMSPRQPVTAAPYAYGLVPGAVISSSLYENLILQVSANMVGNPMALHAIADGQSSLSIIKPVGVFGESHTGYGLFGSSDNLIGVGGFTSSSQWPGIYGSNTYAGDGVQGETTTGNGVYGTSMTGNGLKGSSSSGNGVLAISITGNGITATSTSGYGVHAVSGSSGAPLAALYAENTGGGYGIIGKSGNVPIFAQNTSGPTAAYLATGCCAADLHGTVNIQGNLSVTGSKSGFVVDFAKSDDEATLAVGDVVAVTGSAAPLNGDIPTAIVVRATSAYQTGVVGIVDQHVKAGEHISYDDHPITRGEYLSIVTLGMFRKINVDAAYGAIHAGDLLVASLHAGFAMRASDRARAVGAIIGKALSDWDSGSGAIPVLVTLQ